MSAGADGEAADGEADEADGRAAKRAALLDDEETELTPAQAAKKAKFSAMFEQLHQASTGSTNKLSKSTISLASLCSNTDPKKKRNTDLVSWHPDRNGHISAYVAKKQLILHTCAGCACP